MKKITKYLIIPLFSIFAFFLLFNTNVSAAIADGGSTGNDNVVVLPDDGIFEPCVSEDGCILTDEAVEQVNLYEECHTYITTNIISNESLVEALNGKIYTTFTQEDCMEMINIASKREVIKNELNLNKAASNTAYLTSYSYENETLSIIGLWWIAYEVDVEPYTSYYLSYTFSGNGLNNVNFYDTSINKYLYGISGNGGVFYTGEYNKIKILFVSGSGDESKPNLISNYSNVQFEKGTTSTPYVSYDYHREYYEEGIDYADNRVNTSSTSYTQGVTDADNRVNTDSTNYKSGVSSGYEKAVVEGKSLGT